jgi:hypothetical protein
VRTRREFLKLLGAGLAVAAAPGVLLRPEPPNAVSLSVGGLRAGDRVSMLYSDPEGLEPAVVPYIDREAAGSYERVTTVYSTDRQLVVRVRDGAPTDVQVLPFDG